MITEHLLILFGALTLADHITTNIFLKMGIGEANPLLARVLARWGATGLFVVKAAIYAGMWFLHLQYGPLPFNVVALLCAVYAAVVAWNLYNIITRTKGNP